jgi:hypothetical protein
MRAEESNEGIPLQLVSLATEGDVSMKCTLAVVLLVTAIACTVSKIQSDTVHVPGNAPAAEKLRIAEEVGRRLYNERLKPELKTRYGYTDQQLDGLFVQWNTTTVGNLFDRSAPSEPIVTLTVGIRHTGDLPHVEEAVAFCVAEAKKEFARHAAALEIG